MSGLKNANIGLSFFAGSFKSSLRLLYNSYEDLWQLIRYVVLPESAPHLLSQILYMLDYNIRQTSILGLVGAGGIGFTHFLFHHA